MDGPIGLDNWPGFYSTGQANFASTVLGGLQTPTTFLVSAGQPVSANVTLPPNAASKVNITFVGLSSGNTVQLGPGPLYLPRGRSYEIAAMDSSRATNSTFSFSAPGITRVGNTTGATLSDGTPIRLQNITVGAAAAPGPSTVTLANSGSASALPGGTVVTVNPAVATPLRDGAGYGTALSPGSYISIFGTDLAESTVEAQFVPLPTSLGGVSVKIGNRFAPLRFVSPEQINALIPFEVSGQVNLQVVTGPGGAGNVVPINLSLSSPGLFSVSTDGQGQGIIQNSDNPPTFAAPVGSVAGASSRPARRNDVIVIYASGLGLVTPALPSGLFPAMAGTTLRRLVNPLQVRIGGQLATVEFEGLSPDYVGLYQVNVRIPASAPLGDAVPVQITTFEGQASNPVTLAITQ